MTLWKCCTEYASKFGKLSSGHRIGKGQFSFQSQRKAMPKNAQTTTKLHSAHTLAKYAQNSPSQASVIREPWISRCSSWFRKGTGTRDQIANICWIIEKARKFQKNIYFCFIDYSKAFDYMDHNKLWKILQEMGIPDHLTCLLRNLYAGQEATVRTGHGARGWFQIGKGVCQGCILSPCLFNIYAEYIMWNAIWIKHKLESRLSVEISITSDMQMTPPLWQKVKRNSKASWWKWKRRVKKLA